MRSITAGGPGFVAVGYDIPSEDRPRAAVWVSTDSLDWSRLPHDDRFFGGLGPVMRDVAAGGPGLVAVGSDGDDDEQFAAAWFSRDGLSWNRVLHDREMLGGEGLLRMAAVTSGGPGLVAVGTELFEDPTDESGDSHQTNAAVWVSSDD